MRLQENDLLVAGYVICYDLFLSFFPPHTDPDTSWISDVDCGQASLPPPPFQ